VVEKKEPRRLERQADMSLAEMLSDLPKHCTVGTKRNAKGHTTSCIGYKLHLDVADGDIPVTGLLTSDSLHDSQAAIPLATMTAGRVINLYNLMDSAYDALEISAKSRALGHVPIIDRHPRNVAGGKAEIKAEARGRKCAGYELAEAAYPHIAPTELILETGIHAFGGGAFVVAHICDPGAPNARSCQHRVRQSGSFLVGKTAPAPPERRRGARTCHVLPLST
jgi:hypothetical protein